MEPLAKRLMTAGASQSRSSSHSGEITGHWRAGTVKLEPADQQRMAERGERVGEEEQRLHAQQVGDQLVRPDAVVSVEVSPREDP